MKKEMLSLNSWIKEAAEWQQPLDEFLIDYNMRELECSQEDLLAKMQEMLDVMEKSVEHGLSGVRSHSGLTGGDAKNWLQLQAPKALSIFWARRLWMQLSMLQQLASAMRPWDV